MEFLRAMMSGLKYLVRILRSTDPRQDFSSHGNLKLSYSEVRTEILGEDPA